jgi:peptidoglycan DL-endopeptidase CwlO
MMVKKKLQWGFILTLCLAMVVSEGCSNSQSGGGGQASAAATSQRASMLVANKSTFPNVAVYRERNGLLWVPLHETAQSMDLNVQNVDGSFTIGDTDAAYTVKVNQTQALVGDNPIILPQAPRLFNNKPYMTTRALSTLMGTPVNWNASNAQVIITPVDDSSLSEQQGASAARQPGMMSAQQVQSLSLTSAKKNDLISFGQTLMGTPYKFSAGPYNRTRAFDCSSFVQYVYSNFGVRLPRSSRSQAQVGTSVAANQLQPGDLMFFYTPGRFASNRIVGHVGIYAGNGKILHTYGRPGVTFTDFNAYWKRRFLFAKRVA